MILVTGANGFIGRHLISTLLNTGSYLRAADLNFSNDFPKSDKLECVAGDICDRKYVDTIMKDVTTIVHLAAIVASSDERLNHEINVVGTSNLLAANEQTPSSRFIFMSAAAAKFISPNAYGLSKRLAERLVETQDNEYIIIRIPLVIGPQGEEYTRFVEYVNKLPFIVPIFGSGKALKRPIYIRDVIDAILALIQKEKWEHSTLEIASKEEVTFNELVDLQLSVQANKKLKIYIPLWLSLLVANAAEVILGDKSPITRDIVTGINEDVIFDTETALNYLSLSPKTVKTSIKLSHAEYKKN